MTGWIPVENSDLGNAMHNGSRVASRFLDVLSWPLDHSVGSGSSGGGFLRLEVDVPSSGSVR